MTKNMKRLSVAAVAGASSLSLLAGHAAHAALTVTWTVSPNVNLGSEGTFDRYTFNVTAITGADAVAGPANQDPEILLFEGTWSAVGAGGVIMVPGANANPGLWTNYIAAAPGTAATVAGATSPANKSSFVNLPGLFGTQVRSGTGTASTNTSGSLTAVTGTSASFTGHWLQNNPGTSAGAAGGIEPSVSAGRLAIMYVTHGDGLSFAGDYGTYATVAGQAVTAPEAFSTVVTVGSTTHNIINLTSATQTGGSYGVQLTSGTGANQATFAPNTPVAGTINVTKTGANSYLPGFANGVSGATAGTGAIADFAAISGFAAGDQEIYALKLLVGSSTPTSTQISSIVSDISGQSGDGVSTVANLLSTGGNSLAAQIAGQFPGYDLMLTVTSGTTTPFLGFDFSQETNVAGVVVTNIVAVPEPASAAILLIGSGLLMGRRKRNALMA